MKTYHIYRVKPKYKVDENGKLKSIYANGNGINRNNFVRIGINDYVIINDELIPVEEYFELIKVEKK